MSTSETLDQQAEAQASDMAVTGNGQADAAVGDRLQQVSISVRRPKNWWLADPEWMADDPGFRLNLFLDSDGFGADANARIGIGATPAGGLILADNIIISPALQKEIQALLPQAIAMLKREPIDVLIYRCELDSDKSIDEVLHTKGLQILGERRTGWGRALVVSTNAKLREAVRIAKFIYKDDGFCGLWVGAAPTADFAITMPWV